MKHVLVIDNYDSFVHNLARSVRLAGAKTTVVRNDAFDAASLADSAVDAILLSPGPGKPSDAGCCVPLVREWCSRVPILGVCLGHQAIVEAFGGTVGRAPRAMHGHTSEVRHRGDGLFEGIASPLRVCRYHSLVAERLSLPDGMRVTAETDDGIVMAIEHTQWPVFGVQFHPEAILTEAGQSLIDNFIGRVR